MRLDWKAVVGFLVTVLLLWIVLRGVDVGEVLAQVRRGDPLLLLGAVVVATAGFVLRALRWKVLLAPLDPETRFRPRFAAVAIGFMANNVLPARIGEFARAYAFGRLSPVSATGALGTLVVERFLDALVLLGFLLVVVSLPVFPAGEVLRAGTLGSAVNAVALFLGILLVGMVVLIVRPRPFIRAAEWVAIRLPGDFARPIVDALEAFVDALRILRRPDLVVLALGWTVVVWLWNAFSFHLGMLAFGIRPEGTFVAAIFTQAIVAFGVALPSAPGFFGTFHAAADWALSGVYGVAPAQSLAFAFGYHLGGWLPITVIGAWYAWRIGLSLGDVGRSEERVESAVEADLPRAGELVAGLRGAGGGDPAVPPSGPPPRSVEILAPAKVNLVLRVLEREPSGYHRLETVFQAVGWSDHLRVEVLGSEADAADEADEAVEGEGAERPGSDRSGTGESGGEDHGTEAEAPRERIELRVEGADLGPLRENLVWRAAEAFLDEAGIRARVAIRLRKEIPAGAGLGGGSSDAAATLRALDHLFGGPLPPARLRAVGARLGSDVPFFLGESPLALGRGRGELLTPLPPLPEAHVVLAVPPERISTVEAYGALARSREGREGGARPPAGPRGPAPLDPGEEGLDWPGVATLAANDFEDVVLPERPGIRHLRKALAGTDPLLVLLSGSGSAVFAVYGTRGAAEEAAERVGAAAPQATLRVTTTLERFPDPRRPAGSP